MRKDYIGTIYTGVSDAFQRGLFLIARCIKAMNHDLGVVEVIKLQKEVDMKHEDITIAESRAEQSRAESGLLALWTIGLTILLNLLIEYTMQTVFALRYLLAVAVEYNRR